LTVYQVAVELKYNKKPWTVSMTTGSDPVFTFASAGWIPWSCLDKTALRVSNDGEGSHREKFVGYAALDPWLMRERFFGVDRPQDALDFFREFGIWRYSRGDEDDSSIQFPLGWTKDSEGEPLQVSFDQLIYQRHFFEDALSDGPAEWERRTRETGKYLRYNEDENDAGLRVCSELVYLFGGTLSGPQVTLGLVPEMTYPGPFCGQMSCHEIQDSLRATVLLDWMEGREWPRCKECKRLFKRTSKHPQIYCSARCSGRARQERFRKGGK